MMSATARLQGVNVRKRTFVADAAAWKTFGWGPAPLGVKLALSQKGREMI